MGLLRVLNLSAYPRVLALPSLTGQTVTGEMVSVTESRGRVVLVNFWATWCAECHMEMPLFERLHQDFAAQGLTVLGINVREETQHIQQYAREFDLTYPLFMDHAAVMAKAYGVIGLPTTFVVGRDGRPVALAIGPQGLGTCGGAGARPGAASRVCGQREVTTDFTSHFREAATLQCPFLRCIVRAILLHRYLQNARFSYSLTDVCQAAGVHMA
jgi:thiol-disulfide isomerase/thioredoxin